MKPPLPKPLKSRLLYVLIRNYSSPLIHVALSTLSGWMMVQGIKGLAGLTVNARTAAADLVGAIVVVGIARVMCRAPKAK